MVDLPQSVKDLVEFSPIEDVMLALLRDYLPDISVQSLIWDEPVWPFVLVRRSAAMGMFGGDHRFLDTGGVEIHTFTRDPDGDEDGAVLSEAVRVAVHRARREQKVYPGLGHITQVEMTSPPRRVSDWATASGPVQYADLPAGVWRYQSIYQLEIRKPRVPRFAQSIIIP